ncbi:4-(cytidine 5'-diphospho)-2-C-methyl-D-erythritol kinase [Oscillibacter sp.]|uniref:4-(cytidine 5'-diphospho)-2-C-methyl-D-erythritol kinase n=1 Tax=Oscillibacter sp. TaxID=1945593 RepID=UPI002637298D|nr:4-(cytidine 5'-diphospho)-2-C-methyl-D-erythritol kinase [Oscillibacter sp.]MDD3346899.1 4-(cytidine 5'-diphospho)-2-C-methyl-D-erythritol kinase [Oscillibacter sp.]
MERMAPCKVNLALDILGRRADGYHELRMVMQTVSLCDTVRMTEAADGFRFSTSGDFVPAGRKTLEQRAAEAFFAWIGQPMPGLCVALEKRTPAYAGLGGGSADVAALLHMLRDTYAPRLSGEALERIGFSVGSDMPFCVRGGTALAEGRGERLTDLPALPACWFVLCKPDFGIPTPALFALADEQAHRGCPDIAGMTAALEEENLEGVAKRLCNVFEEVLPPEYREVFTIRDRLRELGALNAAMSGSGPTVFGVFKTEDAASMAAAALRETYSQTFVAQPVQRMTP